MARTLETPLPDLARYAAHPLAVTAERYDRLLDLLGDSRLALLGEATHGTHEFYYERARITQRLVSEKGFSAV
jgi:erythromycin esterase-like protein